MSKFRVGDRVRCLDKLYGTINFECGEESIVTGIVGTSIRLIKDGKEDGWFYDMFELVEPEVLFTYSPPDITKVEQQIKELMIKYKIRKVEVIV